jgi:hypothetical protein
MMLPQGESFLPSPGPTRARQPFGSLVGFEFANRSQGLQHSAAGRPANFLFVFSLHVRATASLFCEAIFRYAPNIGR